ncbi:putative disease resistance RPP13-like protein 1 [Arachis hypogaea]|uniref:putative disease resistance RPP13-like protein 1 n=1 Tax=Arachis hypogaea TaxID=3818 RepID=UPI0010FC4666|nr:putative disease resistance RPP13-like protein 1 [Arachis hypogaea]XP_029149371.1 putative disease resistance RPP13-like protein 1 [Arachis hypogaea]XP_029149372.1 putative disease resistance RPP13-like protein 1 [Arachis hypogaea]XP_029149378.1 putative disease resistance RPP13-like protein 1 [Arachis hypogaea]XP_029149381.1 putative disease resistance RPP13-like protein 1 [Arachis hypogaea]XP_029149382.1 putative disease resistance RPP13-like protein 1 [Arachis hypogaea]XP_029149383.1 pu
MDAKLYGGAYLTSFVDAVLDNLTSILEEDDSFLERNNLLERLQTCLYDVVPVLDDAELKQFTNKRVKKWLVDLQDALYMADDLLDEISTIAAIDVTQRDPGNSSSWSGVVDWYIQDNGNMEKIVGKLESVVRHKHSLGLEKSAKVDMSWRIPSTSLIVSSDIFGRDKDKEEIIKLLLDDTRHVESPVTVIPIVGMGGIGKTTLAQLVYSDVQVVEKFDTRVWVCVAENSDPVHVTRTIIAALDSRPCSMDNFDFLQSDLKKKLTGKTFLIVLDDVLHDQRDTWEDFLKPFRDGNTVSKILLTTRSEKVASVFAAPNRHYQLSLLSNEYCWSVFLKHSCISTNSEQYATLEPIGKKIVAKCKGLPLAVKTLGGILRNKYNVRDWENILESEIWELPEDESKIVPALRVSYHYLPSHLKRCFVYCSLYPQDYQFDKDELILLWMAEGLLQPIGNNALEDIGFAYFDELVARSFFQFSSAGAGLFVMHDLMHDLATFFAGKFLSRVDEFGNPHMADSKTRHLSYWDPISRFLEAYKGAIYMRTFLRVHVQSNYIECDFWRQQLKCLRVLSFRHFEILSLPDSIGELIHLRYLDLSYTSIVTLPESLCRLYNLQTLKLTDCKELEMLPNRMQDLVNLRHLDITGADSLKEMPKGMSNLKHLNFLTRYIVGKQVENGIRELGALDDLHGSLCISKLENVNDCGEALEAKMGNKKHIIILDLKWLREDDAVGVDISDDEFLAVFAAFPAYAAFPVSAEESYTVDVEKERDILEKLQPHRNLKELSIYRYRGETFPDWLGLPCYSNMTKLILFVCKNCRQVPSLGQLPSLQRLVIWGVDGLERIGGEFYNNAELSHQGTPFRSLQTLAFGRMPRWREWHIPKEFDGFPKLKRLLIFKCPVLSGDLPAHLPALEELDIRECPEMDSFGEECLPPSLTTLRIYNCQKLERWITSKGLQSEGLTHLSLREWNEVKSFPREGCLPASLKSLHLSSFSNLETLDCKGLHQLTSLQNIKIEYCRMLENITQQNLPASISKLHITGNCRLWSKLEKMNDPRIQLDTGGYLWRQKH